MAPLIDNCIAYDPIPIWRGIGAQRKDGDTLKTSYSLDEVAEGRVQQFEPLIGKPYRRLRLVDGDDHWGERCELGNNSIHNAPVVYREGEVWETSYKMRFAKNFPISTTTWQVVMQMKQVKPYAQEDTNGSPIIALEANRGGLSVKSHGQTVDYGPTVKLGKWINIKFVITYSKDASRGKLAFYVDGQNYISKSMRTLKYAATSDSMYVKGDPIPSSLRIGPYRNSTITGSTHVDFRQIISFQTN